MCGHVGTPTLTMQSRTGIPPYSVIAMRSLQCVRWPVAESTNGLGVAGYFCYTSSLMPSSWSSSEVSQCFTVVQCNDNSGDLLKVLYIGNIFFAIWSMIAAVMVHYFSTVYKDDY